jgi:hypothetical protein
LIRLDVPIFDLALDANGRLWATTGGGALLELDPASGAILAEHGDGITQALAIHPESGKIYVSTGGGVAIFDPPAGPSSRSAKRASTTSRSRQPASCGGRPGPSAARSSSSRPLGRAQPVVRLDAEVDSLAFGRPGSALAGLLFVSTNDGKLVMIDLVTLQHLTIARGGSRGETVHGHRRWRPAGRPVASDRPHRAAFRAARGRHQSAAPGRRGAAAGEPDGHLRSGHGCRRSDRPARC